MILLNTHNYRPQISIKKRFIYLRLLIREPICTMDVERYDLDIQTEQGQRIESVQ